LGLPGWWLQQGSHDARHENGFSGFISKPVNIGKLNIFLMRLFATSIWARLIEVVMH